MDFEIRKDRRPQGPGQLTRERAAYFQLMQQGYSSKEACRIVGIDARTGQKWRNGRHASGRQKKAVPPIYQEAPPPAGPSRYLREADRIHIADRLREKAAVRAIAAELGRSIRFPDRPEMHVTHETVYQALYVQGRGELRRELAHALRSGRARR